MVKGIKVLKSQKKQYTYLFLDRNKKLEDLPSGLQQSFGEAKMVLEMDLSKDSKLARAKAEEVLRAIENEGFYLQLPPAVEEFEENRR